MKEQEAWLLHARPSGDTSLYLSLFTPNNGLLKIAYKGGRLPKKRSLLQPFTPLWLVLDERYAAYYVKQIEVTGAALHLVADQLFSALYLNELLCLTMLPEHSDYSLYQAYETALYSLAQANTPLALESSLRRFEWALLTASGLSMSLIEEAYTGIAILPEYQYDLRIGEGFVRVNNGLSGAHILAFANNQLDNVAILKTVKLFMRKAINHLLDGKVIKTRQLFLTPSP